MNTVSLILMLSYKAGVPLFGAKWNDNSDGLGEISGDSDGLEM